MATINRLVLVGRLARDPEVREVKPGLTAAKITVCVSSKIRGNGGEEKEELLFMDCTLWGTEAFNAQRFLTKGKAIALEGRLKEERWIDKASGLERRKVILVADNVLYLEKIAAQTDEKQLDFSPRPSVDPSLQKKTASDRTADKKDKQATLDSAPTRESNPEDFEELPF